MKTNTYTFVLLSCFMAIFSIAQTTYNPNSEITNVVIYERGAMVTRNIETDLIKEAGTIIIDSLPQDINSKSLQVNSGNGIKIISVKYNIKQEKCELPAEYESIQNKINGLRDIIQYQNTDASSLIHEIGVIKSNKDFNTDQGANIDQVPKVSELYKSKLRTLKIEQLDIKLNIRRLNNKIYALDIDLIDQTVKTFNNRRVIIKV